MNNKINIFRTVFSGWRVFKEEHASQILAFLLSPHMPHGIDNKFLKKFLNQLLVKLPESSKAAIVEYLKDIDNKNFADQNYRTTILSAEAFKSNASYQVQLEAKPDSSSKGRIDILIKLDDILLVVENKILSCSVGEVDTQVANYVSEIEDNSIIKKINKLENIIKIIPVCILPDGTRSANNPFFTWGEICEMLDEYDIPFVKDFIEFTRDHYQPYQSEDSKQDRNLLTYAMFLKKASKNEKNKGDMEKLIDKILKEWRNLDGADCPDPTDPNTMMLDGPIMWCDVNGTNVYPFKINNNGNFSIQPSVWKNRETEHHIIKNKMNFKSPPDNDYFELEKSLLSQAMYGKAGTCSLADVANNQEMIKELCDLLKFAYQVVHDTDKYMAWSFDPGKYNLKK